MCTSRIHLHKGQSLVLGLSLMAILILALLGMYSNGRLMGEKLRQTNAVDAAAYSGALIQARAFNMQAYINIAQVAHQMAMAHLVTLGSWAKWASTEARSLSRRNPPSWVIATHFGASHGKAYLSSSRAMALSSIAHQQNILHQQFAKHDEIVEKVLAKVSYAIHRTLETSRDKIIQKILESNYPHKNILQESTFSSTNKDLLSTEHYIRPYEETQASSQKGIDIIWAVDNHTKEKLSALFKPRANYRSLISDVARIYQFLGERNYTKKSLLPVSRRCPHKRHELRRRGHTILNDQGNWQSMDTQSYHALRSNRWIGCYYREYPMGWGWVPGQSDSVPEDIEYTQNPPDDFSSEDFWRWVNNATSWNILSGSSNPLANSKAVSERHRWAGGGLVPYVDIKNANKQDNLLFVLSVKQKDVLDHTLTIKGAAETFFERPTLRRDRKKEMANFWHPYWKARLVSLPE
ncbi:hypothetical protein [Pelistega ratti]|uniref:hypothetical protein n=1 Tax=Pelistega ratti TaxID=2652177 RepID=UPI00135B0004|nr:hypothetical protein [Pelistega ratti]